MSKFNRDKWNNAEQGELQLLAFNHGLLNVWQSAGWLTRTIVLLCVVVFVLQQLFPIVYLHLSYFDVLDISNVIGSPWRLITPVFMHGDWMHIAFNLVLWWLIAQQVEKVKGAFELATLVLPSSIVVNVCQYISTGAQFLGLSGVVFALAGYCMTYAYFAKEPSLQLSMPVMLMLLISLLIGVVLGEWLNIGNASHISGLLFGVFWGFCQGKLS